VPDHEVVDHTARTRISGVTKTLDELKKDVKEVGEDVHAARMEFTRAIHDALIKMAPLTFWVKLLSMAAIALVFGVLSLVGTMIWKKMIERTEERAPVSNSSERTYPDRAER
jgi:hypothetical protein